MNSEFHYPAFTGRVCGSVFTKAYKEYKLDMYEFAKTCLTEDFITCSYFHKDCSYNWWFDTYCMQDLYCRLEMLGKVKRYSKDPDLDINGVYWGGYMYGYWACKYGNPEDIWRCAPFDEVMKCYPAYHTVDPEESIYLFKRDWAYRNGLGKYYERPGGIVLEEIGSCLE